MKRALSDGDPVNSRPSRLETDQDLLRDQLNYFRTSSQLPHLPERLQDVHQQQEDDHFLSILSRPAASETPSSSSLEPIKERVVSRRSRRRPRPSNPSTGANPFPTSSLITNRTPNRFARKRFESQPSQPQQCVTGQACDSSISEQVRAQLESMSIEQIRAAQQEIYGTLKPESIRILNKMWLRKAQSLPKSDKPAPSTETVTATTSLSSPEQSPTRFQHPSSTRPMMDNEHPVLQHPLSTDAHTELLVPKKADESDEEERNKRMWMTGAEEPAPSQKEVDQVIEKALETLGDVGKLRFGLDGAFLSSEEVQTLPTHLGLHHHGSSPASAGYTLSDILVLMRSTVVGQRVVAMRMLKSIVLRHRDEVVAPLIESGTLTSAFSHLPVDESFHAAITNQVVYLELVETFAKDYLLDNYDSVNNLYFGSNFYSPCHVKGCGAVIKALADSDVVTTLIGIARANAMRPEHIALAERAIRLVRMFVTRIPEAANRVLQNKSSLLSLKTLTTTSTASYAPMVMLSCHVLSHIVVSLGWKGDQVLEQLQVEVIDDRFVHTVSSRMIWLLDSDIEEITADQSIVAKGVLRLIRAALTFQRGIESFSALAHAVCRLVRHETTAVETYLALEAYSHSLFVQASYHRNEEDPDKTSSGNVRDEEEQDQIEDRLISRRLSDLIPNAISATTVFVDANVRSEETRAAAGHFAATLFALTSHPIVEDYVVRIFNVSSSSADELAQLVAVSPKSIQKFQGVASLSHAAARLLSKVKLEEQFALREVNILMAASSVEMAIIEKPSTVSMTHIVANACAEWIGLYSRVGSSKTTIEFALELIPCLTDVRVIVDLLSRTVLNVTVLQGLCPTLSAVSAAKCAKDLLPMAMTELSSLQKSRSEAGSTALSISFDDLCNIWVAEDEVYESLFTIVTAFFESELLEGTGVFECLLRTPVTRYSDSLFEFMFKVGRSCVYQGAPLIAALHKTKVSTLSTTMNPPTVDSVLLLCDFLLSRGPASPTSAHNENPDFLSSILLTLMCGSDVDNTLRVSMWKRTVDDCGGAALYQDAVALEGDRSAAKTGSCLELDDMLRLFGVSIAEGYLDGERCPSVLRNAILSRLQTALSCGRSASEVFEVLASSVRSRSSLSQQLVKLVTIMPAASAETDKILSGFLDQVRFLC